MTPYQHHSRTSHDAARVAELSAGTKRSSLLAFLVQQGEAGATDEEMQRYLPMFANTQRPRRIELVRHGLARDSGRVRKNLTGVLAAVWVAL